MQIYDSSKKNKVEFKSITPGQVSIYVCGPTVYDRSHLGHARSSLAYDLLQRTLEQAGYSVRLVKNFTDIDDKIISKSKEYNMSTKRFSNIYIHSYKKDMDDLNVLAPSDEPRVSEYMFEILTFVNKLIDLGVAYRTDSGSVYLDVSKDEKYGSLFNMAREIEVESNDSEKKNKNDFAIWKDFSKPGWHIECSAMIEELFQGTIDIHGGGEDLKFPHHENEAAQSRLGNGRELSNYWMHNGFVTVNGEKMSKSLNNSVYIEDAIKEFGGETLRNYLISTNYKNSFDFTKSSLIESKKRLNKLYRRKEIALYNLGETFIDYQIENNFKEELFNAMADDLNISESLAIIDEMLRTETDDSSILINIQFISQLLGIGELQPIEYFTFGYSKTEIKEINRIVMIRNQAKKDKNYAYSDALRNELLTKFNVTIEDLPNGLSLWQKNMKWFNFLSKDINESI